VEVVLEQQLQELQDVLEQQLRELQDVLEQQLQEPQERQELQELQDVQEVQELQELQQPKELQELQDVPEVHDEMRELQGLSWWLESPYNLPVRADKHCRRGTVQVPSDEPACKPAADAETCGWHPTVYGMHTRLSSTYIHS